MTKWTIGGQEAPSNTTRKKLAYRPAFEITEKMPKGQQAGAQSFNEMRERLILLGEMEEK